MSLYRWKEDEKPVRAVKTKWDVVEYGTGMFAFIMSEVTRSVENMLELNEKWTGRAPIQGDDQKRF